MTLRQIEGVAGFANLEIIIALRDIKIKLRVMRQLGLRQGDSVGCRHQ